MPRGEVRFFYLEFRPTVLISDVQAERQVVISVLIDLVAAVFFVDAVEVSVDPVLPDNLVLYLFFQSPSELVYQRRVFRNSGVTCSGSSEFL